MRRTSFIPIGPSTSNRDESDQLFQGHALRSVGALLDGYTPFQLLPHGMCTVDLDGPDANTFAYGNFVFEDKDLQGP